MTSFYCSKENCSTILTCGNGKRLKSYPPPPHPLSPKIFTACAVYKVCVCVCTCVCACACVCACVCVVCVCEVSLVHACVCRWKATDTYRLSLISIPTLARPYDMSTHGSMDSRSPKSGIYIYIYFIFHMPRRPQFYLAPYTAVRLINTEAH